MDDPNPGAHAGRSPRARRQPGGGLRGGDDPARPAPGARLTGSARARRPATEPGASGLGLLLAPGAGAGRDQPALLAIDDAVTATGAQVRRMDFPYRIAGRQAPDRLPVLVEAVAAEARLLGKSSRRLVLGGRSMGGRVCSVAVAEGADLGPAAVAGLVLVSYPLHPPARPDRRRDAHLPDLHVPCLFVSGTRDAFGTVPELEEAVATIPAPVRFHWVQGGDHGLRRRDLEVAAVVADWVADLSG